MGSPLAGMGPCYAPNDTPRDALAETNRPEAQVSILHWTHPHVSDACFGLCHSTKNTDEYYVDSWTCYYQKL